MSSATPQLAIAGLVAMAVIARLAYRRAPRSTGAAAAVISATCFAVFAWQASGVARGASLVSSFMWVPSFGVEAAFRIDGLSLVFVLLITGIGAIILAYTPSYCSHAPSTGRLLSLLLAFEASMLGLVAADDTITLFVFWELTSFASFFLIAFHADSDVVRTRARQALIITAAGGLVLLVGLLVLADAARPGSISIRLSTLAATDLRAHAHYGAIVVLIAIGAFTKSAQVPFHFWLPGAMVAATPVSAYLHSATMVKAGVYLLARLHPNLGGTPLWTWLLVGVGTTTFVTGSLLAVVQRDIKLTLAYATVGALGALTLLLGIGTTEAIGAALVLLVAHASYKAALFLATGNLDHHRGTRDPFAPLTRRDMPITAMTAVLAAASMAGVPPLIGFIAKDAIYAATLPGPAAAIVTTSAVVAGAAFVTSAWLAGVAPYLRGRSPWARSDAPPSLLVGPAVLAIAGFAFGVAPDLVEGSVIAPAVSAVTGDSSAYDVALWHGITGTHGVAFWLGIGSIVAGIAGAIVVWRRRAEIVKLRERARSVSGQRAHEAALGSLARAAGALTHTIQHGRLPLYVGTMITAMAVAVAFPFFSERVAWQKDLDTNVYEIALLAITAAAVLAATLYRDRLSSVAALSAAGLAVTFLFALYSGPDLAITQLTVETMMLILLVLLFRRIGPAVPRAGQTKRLFRLVVASTSGVLVALLLMAATTKTGFAKTASAEQTRLAPSEHFENVVNAILVDFRALDTLGEITVITIAGIGVAALARIRRREP